jgi:hypothetical protein
MWEVPSTLEKLQDCVEDVIFSRLSRDFRTVLPDDHSMNY